MRIGIIGSGKVAYQLSLALYDANHHLSFIVGRNNRAVQSLASKVKAKGLSNIAQIPHQEIDVLLIAVKDDAISEVAEQVPPDYRGILAHTSGAGNLKLLGVSPSQKGIFYPLYSFRNKRKKNLSKIPFLITSPDASVQNTLIELARSISQHTYVVNDHERAKLHLAAVYANNFSNFMMTLSFDILEKNALDQNILLPIIQQSAQAWTKGKAKDIQTGPAIRDDIKTIEKHMKQIDLDAHKKMYALISENITKYYK